MIKRLAQKPRESSSFPFSSFQRALIPLCWVKEKPASNTWSRCVSLKRRRVRIKSIRLTGWYRAEKANWTRSRSMSLPASPDRKQRFYARQIRDQILPRDPLERAQWNRQCSAWSVGRKVSPMAQYSRR